MTDHADSKDPSEEASDLVRNAEGLMMQAELLQGAARGSLLLEAKDVLLRAEQRRPGAGAWALACIGARTGNGELCRKWLERAQRSGELPEREEIERSPYLQSMRGARWFRGFLKGLA